MNKMLLTVCLPDGVDVERAKRVGRLHAQAIASATDALVAQGLIVAGEFVTLPEPSVVLERAHVSRSF